MIRRVGRIVIGRVASVITAGDGRVVIITGMIVIMAGSAVIIAGRIVKIIDGNRRIGSKTACTNNIAALAAATTCAAATICHVCKNG